MFLFLAANNLNSSTHIPKDMFIEDFHHFYSYNMKGLISFKSIVQYSFLEVNSILASLISL